LSNYKIATRASSLAKKQAAIFAELFSQMYPNDIFELLPMTTAGDHTPGLLYHLKKAFVGELQLQVLNGTADMAVHSLKDMSVFPTDSLFLACVLARDEVRDVFVSQHYASLAVLPDGACVGTSSARRVAQIRAMYPQLKVKLCRGNVLTRLEKLQRSEFDALILAGAGLQRLGLLANGAADLHIDFLSMAHYTPACGQGVIAVEISVDNIGLKDKLSELIHQETYQAIMIEREIVRRFGGNCSMPLGVHVAIGGSGYDVYVFLGDVFGKRWIKHQVFWSFSSSGYFEMIDNLVEYVLSKGGKDILDRCHQDLQQGFHD